jgi:hypothetical protein
VDAEFLDSHIKLERRNKNSTQAKSCIIRDEIDDVGDDEYDDNHVDELFVFLFLVG